MIDTRDGVMDGEPGTRHRSGKRDSLCLVLLSAAALLAATGCGTPPAPSTSGPAKAPSHIAATAAANPFSLSLDDAVDLFKGTPAADFAVGEAGLVVPAPPEVAGASVEQVSHALQTVRQELVESFLDNRLLVEHDPAAVLGPLAPDTRNDVRSDIVAGHDGTTFIQFTAGSTLAAPPRLNGGLTVTKVDFDGFPALDVTSNYVVVYAFRGAQTLVLVRSQSHWLFPLSNDLAESSVGMYLGTATGFWEGMDCAASARGLTGPAPLVDPDAKPFVVDTHDPNSYYDPNTPPTVTDGCLDTTTVAPTPATH